MSDDSHHTDTQSLEAERLLFRYFVVPSRRNRYLALLADFSKRGKLRKALAHFRDLDPRFARKIEANVVDPDTIVQLLRARGAPSLCNVISEWDEIDRQRLPLEDAIRRIVGMQMTTFVSCVPERLGYYEGEDLHDRYILER